MAGTGGVVDRSRITGRRSAAILPANPRPTVMCTPWRSSSSSPAAAAAISCPDGESELRCRPTVMVGASSSPTHCNLAKPAHDNPDPSTGPVARR